MSTSAHTQPRTLADQLRSWSDAQLGELLSARPDLASPTPQDTSQLASRVGTRASVLRALDQLSSLDLTVLDAVLALGGTASASAVRAAVHAADEKAGASLDLLRTRALVWGSDDSLRALSVLNDLLGTTSSRLGPTATSLLGSYGAARVAALARDLGIRPSGDRHDDVLAVTAHLSDAGNVRTLVGEVDDQARAILEHLEREGREGSVESTERATSRSTAGSPVDQLLARGLVVARDRRHVAVPREVAL